MRRRYALITGLLFATGCFSYRAEPGVSGGNRVRLRFEPPRSVAAVVTGRDTLHLPPVTLLEGVVLAANGDTLTLDVRDARTQSGSVREIVGGSTTAVVQLAAGTCVEVRRVDRARTAVAAVGIPTLVVIGFLLFWVANFHGDT